MTPWMWSRDVSLKYFLVYNFLPEMSTFKQDIWLNFGKRTVQNLQTSTHFQKKSQDQLDEIIDQLRLLQKIPNISFKFLPYQEICK